MKILFWHDRELSGRPEAGKIYLYALTKDDRFVHVLQDKLKRRIQTLILKSEMDMIEVRGILGKETTFVIYFSGMEYDKLLWDPMRLTEGMLKDLAEMMLH